LSKTGERRGLSSEVPPLRWQPRGEVQRLRPSPRRNLTDEQRAVLIGRLYERQKKAPKGFEDRDLSGGKFCPRERSHVTAKAIAKEVGVSERTVRSAAGFAKAYERLKEISLEALRAEVPAPRPLKILACPGIRRLPLVCGKTR